uniref:Uncharacterized protein n=1 Tax=Faecalibaculum rodentium TaxID=1702221 RepID=A0A140DYG7_9FIRM|nr:hypothetical protein AALO17_25600 [Faecalibaculum rodentium]
MQWMFSPVSQDPVCDRITLMASSKEGIPGPGRESLPEE